MSIATSAISSSTTRSRSKATATTPSAGGGDSGSLIVDAERKTVALLFALSDLGGSNGKGLTYANPIDAVLKVLKVELLFT